MALAEELTDFEKKVYDFIKQLKEVQTTNVPPRMRGALPSLKNKGLIEVYKKRTSLWTSIKKKRTFVRVIDRQDFA